MAFSDHWVRLLGLVPQNLVSFLVGAAVRLRLPGVLQSPLNQGFVSLFGLNMAEASLPLNSYGSIEDIFTRALKPGQRKVSGAFIASSDGILERSEQSESGDTAIQAKGLTYSLAAIVTGSLDQKIDAAWYTTTYLAPHNYHRVHAPFSGRVTGIRYIPGRLWPVNKAAVRVIANLFGINERLVFDFELANGAKAWLVMVGAFNVGRMTTCLDPNFVSNSVNRVLNPGAAVQEIKFEKPRDVSAGDELGIFMLGSTTVVVLDSEARRQLNPLTITEAKSVLMGQSLSQ